MTITITPLQPADIPATIDVIRRSISVSLGVIYPPALIENMCAKYHVDTFGERMKIIDHYVAKTDEGRVVGVLGLQGDNRLRSFYVDPDMQGQGIGRQLYEYVEQEAIRRGTTKMILEGSPIGERAYLKFGFTKLHTVHKSRAGIPFTDAYMEKELTPR